MNLFNETFANLFYEILPISEPEFWPEKMSESSSDSAPEDVTFEAARSVALENIKGNSNEVELFITCLIITYDL